MGSTHCPIQREHHRTTLRPEPNLCPQPDAARDPHLDPAAHLPRCTAPPQNLIDGFAGKGAWRDETASGSLACQDLKSLRSHFSPLSQPTPITPASKLLPASKGGRPTAPNPTPHSRGGLAFADLAWRCHLPQVLLDAPTKERQPQMPELGIDLLSKPCLRCRAALSLPSTHRRAWWLL